VARVSRLLAPLRAPGILAAALFLWTTASFGDAVPPPSLVPPLSPAVATPAIGVLLPLSGRYQTFGESCLNGIRVAVGAIEGRSPVVRTLIFDTKSEPGEAAAQYARLVADPAVVAVLGPMISGEIEATQSAAQAAALPTITFSQRPVGIGGPMFRFTLTKEDQAAVLAQYLVVDLGLRRWAMLHPDDSYGEELSGHFRQAVELLGGRIVADVGYPIDKRDLQAEAKRLAAKVGIVERQTPAATPRPTPMPQVDGVFLPEAAERLAMVVSFLNFVGLTGVQLAGANGWDRPSKLLAANVNGGVFVDGFFLYSFRPEVRAFVDAYRDALHADPGTVEAYGYDAAALVRDFIGGGATTRQAMLAAFRRPLLRRGATGDTLIRPGGRIDKALFLLKVEDGTVRELENPSASTARSDGVAPPSTAGAGTWWRASFDSRAMDERVGH
jgi:ABC-type branched-subunit amino acid transport system substrate-binding protein